jgi:drug/metabolite transporter (DMT)-like permease
MSWLYLALLAPVLYAIVNLFDDNLLEKVYKSPYLSTVFAGLFGSAPLVALIFRTSDSISNAAVYTAISAGFLTVCYLFYYFRALQVESPSVVIALFSLAPAVLPVFAGLFLHEKLSSLALVGFVIVIVASLAMAVIDMKNFKVSAALIPVIMAVILMDIATLLSKYAYEHAQFFPVYMYFSLGMGAGGIVFFLAKYKQNSRGFAEVGKKFKQLIPILIIVELVSLAAEFTLNLAISRGPVSLVKAIENTQPIFVLVIAVVLFPFFPNYFREGQEGKVRFKLLMMAVMLVGVGLTIKASV